MTRSRQGTMKGMRLKRFEVPASLLVEIATQGKDFKDDRYVECLEGVPEGTKCVRAEVKNDYGIRVEVTVTHPSFDEVGEGEAIPWMTPIMRCNHRVPVDGR